jgi:hypothetical protein
MYRLSLLLLSFLLCTPVYAQDDACFRRDAHNDLILDGPAGLVDYKAFFVGEFHGVYGVPEIKLALIKYVCEHYDITDVFMEVGYSTAWLYNQYLQTGDTTLFTSPVLTYAQKKPNRDFWQKLYVYNNGLKHKLTIHGMDFERMDFVKALKLMMPKDKERPAQIRGILSYLDTLSIKSANADIHNKDRAGNELNQLYDSVRQHFITNRTAYRKYYRPYFKDVEQVLLNENTLSKYADRNKAMYHNVVKDLKNEKIKKFIVFAGLNHANKEGGFTLCSRLMNAEGLKDRLATIAMICKDCYDWQQKPEHRFESFRGPLTYVADTVLLKSIYQRYYSAACPYTLLPAATTANKKVTDFSDYLILMRDQPEY